MPQYDVYGLGNALVDIEYEVTVEQLTALGIDKGVMTLVDEDRQQTIIQQLDRHMRKKGSGGSAANTVIAVSQFGGKAFYSCKVASDEMGHFYMQDLLDGGVQTNIHADTMEGGVTGKCLVFVTPDADRTMNTYLGVSQEFSRNELVADVIRDSAYLYIEGYLVTGELTKDAAVQAREMAEQSGVKTALSLSDPNMVKFFKDGLLEMIGKRVDLLFANEDEALGMADSSKLEDAIAHLKTLSKSFAITRGAQGSLLYDQGSLIEIPAVKAKAVDTVGAGDMFAGAYLYGINHGMSAQNAGNLASRAAAKLVSSFGPRLEAAQSQSLLVTFKNHQS